MSDTLEIADYIAQDNQNAAIRMLRRFDELFVTLSINPHLGIARHELAPELRSLSTGSYVVFYRPSDTTLEIVRVLSSYREITPELFEDK